MFTNLYIITVTLKPLSIGLDVYDYASLTEKSKAFSVKSSRSTRHTIPSPNN